MGGRSRVGERMGVGGAEEPLPVPPLACLIYQGSGGLAPLRPCVLSRFCSVAPPTNADCTYTHRLVPIQTLYAAHGHTSARGIDRGNLTSVIDVHLYTPSPTADATRRSPTLRRRIAT